MGTVDGGLGEEIEEIAIRLLWDLTFYDST
jgi:hypothetical protein